MFKVRLTSKARRQLKKLSIQDRISVGEIIEDIKGNPLVGKSLGRELTKKYSYKRSLKTLFESELSNSVYRVGVYRVIYKVNIEDKVVDILEADHRGRVYN